VYATNRPLIYIPSDSGWIGLDCVSDFLFWGVVLMYFIGIGDGASRLLCIFVWRFLVRYYTHFFSLLRPSFQLSQSTASVRHLHARVCSKRFWSWLSTREEKRQNKKGERNQSEWRFLTPAHQPQPLISPTPYSSPKQLQQQSPSPP
jgi:hypothetical protein